MQGLYIKDSLLSERHAVTWWAPYCDVIYTRRLKTLTDYSLFFPLNLELLCCGGSDRCHWSSPDLGAVIGEVSLAMARNWAVGVHRHMADWMVIMMIALSSSWFCPAGHLNALQLQNAVINLPGIGNVMSQCDVTFDCPIAKCAIRMSFKQKFISVYLKFVFWNWSCTYSVSVSPGKVLTFSTLMSVNTARWPELLRSLTPTVLWKITYKLNAVGFSGIWRSREGSYEVILAFQAVLRVNVAFSNTRKFVLVNETWR